MAYPSPKFREVRETRRSKAAQRREQDKMHLQESFEEVELEEIEKEAELASFYEMIAEDHARDFEDGIEEMARYDANYRTARREAQAQRDNDFFIEKDLEILADWY